MTNNKLVFFLGLFLVLSLIQTTTKAQFKDYPFKLGLNANYLLAKNEYGGNGFLGRTFLRLQVNQLFDAEFGVGYGWFGGDDYGGNEYKTDIVPIDLRLLFSPFTDDNWNPYLFAGIGSTWWWLSNPPKYPSRPPEDKYEGFNFLVPIGIGTEIALSKNFIIDVVFGWNAIINDWPNGLATNTQNLWHHDWDRYINAGIGFAYVGENCDSDVDDDNLGLCQEEELGTDPYNSDTDGDRLNDGEEVLTYNTDPLKKDSDGDELNDYDEVKNYMTDPNKSDTDGDGLTDGAEVNTHRTDPIKPDTDGDDLNDGDEVNKYNTDPLNQDSDMDKLADGAEVKKHKTDPLKKDTDGGTIDDGIEVTRGTDPLDPTDDVVSIAVPIVLDGITFELSSARITSSSEARLQKALRTLKGHSSIIVEIRGYCDNTGARSFNMELSQRRAESVRNWLINNGVNPDRLSAKGFGPDNPIASNKTRAGRERNRRIEFVRTK